MKNFIFKKILSIILDAFGFVIYYCGLARVFNYLNKSQAKIINYHYVGDEVKKEIMPLQITHSKENFLKQLEYFINNYHITEIENYKNKSIIITFDDGYNSDIYEYLMSKKIPFYVFIISDAFDKEFLMWRSKEAILNNSSKLQPIKKVSKNYIDTFSNKSNLKYFSGSNYIYINKFIPKEMIKFIGCHSKSHLPLNLLSSDEVLIDLNNSISNINSKLNTKIKLYSLPFGLFPQESDILFKNLTENNIKYLFTASDTNLRCYNEKYKLYIYDRITLRNTSLLFKIFTDIELKPQLKKLFYRKKYHELCNNNTS